MQILLGVCKHLCTTAYLQHTAIQRSIKELGEEVMIYCKCSHNDNSAKSTLLKSFNKLS